ncbi:MAG: phosphate acyltransferase PlsX [Gemmatimonadetes bacterium]|nr:phosphate acyltransferase PlsX [Gemmatimonadota bacterium]NIQ59680.1 phosphate acyltransferase PlsX [Gemmatimonadota bacterium]NIU79877.1 phosphate acyltransferase PlsX [Gammaproteobacteria bacterium]NIX48362.1 phosphate acyltransferase PlsX [Gemmatimonadota bacterium]NIY12809.1 phosphate acyltransferase PlsX [Gemmatimonadota bacterium]
MGTDRHPTVEVEGAVAALEDLPADVRVVLVGDADRIRRELTRLGWEEGDRLEIVHASQRIAPEEAPAAAVRRKPDSSIVVGLNLQKSGEADAFVSAGSTGAVMAASLIMLRPLPGVDRPAIATLLPTGLGPMVMLDAGANVDSKPSNLVQFARLGSVYAHDVLGRESPRVGLLNIGEEPEKGNELSVETHRRLTESDLNFVGNVEGSEIIEGVCDVLVTDGFVGNVLLKFYESVAGFVFGLLRREVPAERANATMGRITRILDYAEYGGAPLLGVNGISIICHGGSPPRAITNALKAAMTASNAHMVGHIREEVGVHPDPA